MLFGKFLEIWPYPNVELEDVFDADEEYTEIKALLGTSSDPQELRSPAQISPSLYYESNIDSNSKFRRLKALLTWFDCEEDLLIKFSNNEPGEDAEDFLDKTAGKVKCHLCPGDREDKMFIEANPQFKTLDLYDSRLKKVYQELGKREHPHAGNGKIYFFDLIGRSSSQISTSRIMAISRRNFNDG